ncbi:hypothetical protein [Mucilaginibacter sp. BT774]|uniref:hypothetical protein n=1 Tax=Mucilaginibacter sp. BT774 TaxID=3062276 RepID=UPI002674F6E5|nr:hypothetical protein [Mucilaginibacter sp. BT774]MDO3627277.1 hypothetical protein [Mucilaginibacter sp. BT774]
MNKVNPYENYSRDELLELVKAKNKKIDSQRSMLNQLREKTDKLKADNRNTKRENVKLKMELNNLNKSICRLTISNKGQMGISPEFVQIIINVILRSFKLKKIIEITNNELFFLIVAYQREFFTQAHLNEFNLQHGRNPDFRWRKEFRDCCEAGLFHKEKIGRKTIYFISWQGREQLNDILEYLYSGKIKRSIVKCQG